MRCLFYVCVMFFFFVLYSGVSDAASIPIGVSPGAVEFNNVLRGGYAERFVTITLGTEENVLVTATPRGDIADWLNYSESLEVSRDSPGRLFISVSPPSDIPNGNYTGFLRISTEGLSQDTSGPTVSILSAVLDLAITVEITDQELLACRAYGYSVESVEEGDDITVRVSVFNEGNIRMRPQVLFDLWDQEQISIVRHDEQRGGEVLPTREAQYEFYLSSDDLELDQHWLDISVPECLGESTLTFDVLEQGALKSEGILLKLLSIPGWIEVKDTALIRADFENVGEKSVDAQFKGQITKDGKIVQVLESELIEVPVSEMTNFTFFFTPRDPGRYVASGRVFYDRKRTFESSAVLEVAHRTFGWNDVFMGLLYIALMGEILWLYLKIRKEKRKYSGHAWRFRRGAHY